MIERQRYLPFWCQKVLPLVYDDSLSYYELLNKVIAYINEHSKAINELGDFYNAIVNDIAEMLSEMMQSGDFDEIILQTIGSLVASPFDPTETYEKYDYCIYESKLYRSTSDEAQTGEFNPSYWEERVMADDVSIVLKTVLEIDAGDIAYDTAETYTGSTVGAFLNWMYTNGINSVEYSGTSKKLVYQKFNGTKVPFIDVEDVPSNSSSKLPSSKAFYNLANGFPRLDGKRIIIYGDSISDEEATFSGFEAQPNWVTYLRNHCSAVIDNRSVASISISNANGIAQKIYQSTDLVCDIMIIFAGVNDYRAGRDIGAYNSSANYDTLWGSLTTIYNKMKSASPYTKIYLVSPLKEYYYETYPQAHDPYKVLPMYRRVLQAFANWRGWTFIDGYSAPCLQPYYTTVYQPDKLHANTTYAPILCNYIAGNVSNDTTINSGAEKTVINIADLVTNEAYTFSSLNCYFMQEDGTMEITGSFTYTNTSSVRYDIVTLPPEMRPQAYQICPAYGTLTGEGIPASIVLDTTGNLFLSIYDNPTQGNTGNCIFNIKFKPKFADMLSNVSI